MTLCQFLIIFQSKTNYAFLSCLFCRFRSSKYHVFRRFLRSGSFILIRIVFLILGEFFYDLYEGPRKKNCPPPQPKFFYSGSEKRKKKYVPTKRKPLGPAKFFFHERVLETQVVMCKNFQLDILILSTVFFNCPKPREHPTHPVYVI